MPSTTWSAFQSISQSFHLLFHMSLEVRKQFTSLGLPWSPSIRKDAFGIPALKLPPLAGQIKPPLLLWCPEALAQYFGKFCFSMPKLLSGSLLARGLPTCLPAPLVTPDLVFSSSSGFSCPLDYFSTLFPIYSFSVCSFSMCPVSCSSVLCLNRDLGKIPVPPLAWAFILLIYRQHSLRRTPYYSHI